MKAPYRGGTIRANNKSALISFNPGWGEPGEWNIAFVNEFGKSDGYLTLDAADSYSSQQEYWNFMKYGREHYPEKFDNFDWAATVGNYEDAIRIGLDYTGYDDNALERDLALQNRVLAGIEQTINDLADDPVDAEHLNTLAAKVEAISQFMKKIGDDWTALETCIAVYRALVEGKPVGCGWTAETL